MKWLNHISRAATDYRDISTYSKKIRHFFSVLYPKWSLMVMQLQTLRYWFCIFTVLSYNSGHSPTLLF